MICESIAKLVKYALDCGLIEQEDKIYTTNRILEILCLDEYKEPTDCEWDNLENILKEILDYACENGLIKDTLLNSPGKAGPVVYCFR